MRERVAAIIIKDKKLLLVTEENIPLWWTPGGGVEAGESYEECMQRELQEELSVKLKSLSPYLHYETKNEITGDQQKVHCHIIEYNGNIQKGAEISDIFWYARTNYIKRNPKTTKGIETHLIPKLLQDNLL